MEVDNPGDNMKDADWIEVGGKKKLKKRPADTATDGNDSPEAKRTCALDRVLSDLDEQ